MTSEPTNERNKTWDDRIAALREERAALDAPLDGRPGQVARLSVRSRVAALVDAGSFLELGGLATGQQEDPAAQAPADGVISGFGTIGGTTVVVLSEDADGLTRTDAQVARNKRTRMTTQAVWRGLPLVYLADGSPHAHPVFPSGQGMLLDRVADQRPARHLGERTAPFVAVVAGHCRGQEAALVAHADLIIATPDADISLAEEGYDAIADVCVDSDADAVAVARHAIELLADPVADPVAASGQRGLFDAATMIETSSAGGVTAGLARLDGRTVAFVDAAGQTPCHLGRAALTRVARAAAMARRFAIPFVALQDCDGYASEPGTLLAATSIVDDLRECLSSPVISVVTGHGFVLGDFVLGGRAAGYDLIVAWPDASFPQSDVRSHTGDAPRHGPFTESGLTLVDEVIAPDETRAYLSAALRLLSPAPNVRPVRHDRGQRIQTLY